MRQEPAPAARHRPPDRPCTSCRELTDLSYPAIAREFGGRDHTTVIHAVEKIGALMKERRQIYDQVTELIQTIRQRLSDAMTVATRRPVDNLVDDLGTTRVDDVDDGGRPRRASHGADGAVAGLWDAGDSRADSRHAR